MLRSSLIPRLEIGLGPSTLLVFLWCPMSSAEGQEFMGEVVGRGCFEVESHFQPFQLESPVEIILYERHPFPLLLPNQPDSGIMFRNVNPVLENHAMARITGDGDLELVLAEKGNPGLRYRVRLKAEGELLVGVFDGMPRERHDELAVTARPIPCPLSGGA